MKLWPWQEHGIGEVKRLWAPGRGVCVTGPTGSGKSVQMVEVIRWGHGRELKVILYTHRRALLEQLDEVLHAQGVEHGVRAAGWDPDFRQRVQLSMVQTESARALKGTDWGLFPAKLVLIDEAHQIKEATAQQLVEHHKGEGAYVVGYSATPLGIAHLYDELVVAGTVKKCIEGGALVPAHQFSPDEPDPRALKTNEATGEFTQDSVRRAMAPTVLWGRVLDWWRRLNPEGRPTILFGPGVKESQWFAEQFERSGIRAAHVDGDRCWLAGKLYRSDSSVRADIRDMSETGQIKVVCNRFVLREGVDWPWLKHGILATAFGTIQSYLQAGGRLLRAYPGIDHVVVQDHGGNYWRHGSLNVDRTWDMAESAYRYTQVLHDKYRSGREPEPICCPKCYFERRGGLKCPNCGHEHERRSRRVLQTDGDLVEVDGRRVPPRKRVERATTRDLWERMYHRFRNTTRTFRQAEAYFFHEHHHWPPRNLPKMPRHERDWYARVRDVPSDRLIQ